MFARQLAVMKGQAWNVVETLKTADHGPLELTRRARALVWDDLVDVPVAVRLNDSLDTPNDRSQQNRRGRHVDKEGKITLANIEDDGMDISSVRPSASMALPDQHYDLLGLPSPATDATKTDNPFNTSRHVAAKGDRISGEDTRKSLSPASATILADGNRRSEHRRSGSGRPGMTSYGTSIGNMRMSLDEGKSWRSPESNSKRRQQQQRRQLRERRFSFGAGGNISDTARMTSLDYHDADDADLGFAAAEDRTSSRKKVIIERLEIVKAKGPVFTWC